MRINDEDFLQYYQRELTYLRQMGSHFAQRFPKVAGRLEIGEDQSPDPNVERLIEAFAFLTGRLQFNLESSFPEITTSLLDILYPHYLKPIPSLSVARFEADLTKGQLTDGHEVSKGTTLITESPQGMTIRFQTCYPVTIWPVELTHVGFEAPDQYDFLDSATNVASVLRLRLETQSVALNELNLKNLRLYINGEDTLVYKLLELLFLNVIRVALLPVGSDQPLYLPKDSIKPVGFQQDENVLPFPPHSHTAYRLIQEYFSFPKKFCFFDLTNLTTQYSENALDILLLMDQIPENAAAVNKNTLMMGCTPIVNLFHKTSEPVRVDHRQLFYHLHPDMRREDSTEIHTILTVSGSSNPEDETSIYQPFFSFDHRMEDRGHQTYWVARREPTGRKELPGTQIHLSLINLEFSPEMPADEVLFAHMLCTNRYKAEELPAQAVLQIEESSPTTGITCLHKPTPQAEPPHGGETLWRLISHLSLNYLSLSEGKQSLKALQEILRLYSFSDSPSTLQQINGVREMFSKRVVRQIGTESWRGFCRGQEVTLVFDERAYVGSSAFLLGSVLSHFLALYASINSFVQVVIKSNQREGIWKQWEPMAGEQIIL